MARGAHSRVDKNLGHSIFSRGIEFHFIGLMHRLHEIDGVVIGDKLQSIGHTVYEVIFANYGHLWFSSLGSLQRQLTLLRSPPSLI